VPSYTNAADRWSVGSLRICKETGHGEIYHSARRFGDAMLLARLDRSGDLTAVRVPDAATRRCAIWCCAREDGVRECRNARHRLIALLLRNGVAYAGKSSWTGAHLRWLPRSSWRTTRSRAGLEALKSCSSATSVIQRSAAPTQCHECLHDA